MHSAQISGFMGTYLIDNASSPTCPRIIKLMSTNPKKQREHTLLTAKNPYEGFEMPSIEVGTIKAADGKTYLAPVIDDVVKEINVNDGYVLIVPMKGIFDDED